MAAVKQQDDRSHSSWQPYTEAPCNSPLYRLKIKDLNKISALVVWAGLIRCEQTTSKAPGDKSVLRVLVARGAIQRAEKGSGFRTVSFEATEARESAKDHRLDLFYILQLYKVELLT